VLGHELGEERLRLVLVGGVRVAHDLHAVDVELDPPAEEAFLSGLRQLKQPWPPEFPADSLS
jgi:hypothetical protein